MTSHWDEKRAAKVQAVLDSLSVAKTYKELANEHRSSYPTIQRIVTELRERKLVRELPFGRGKESLFVRMFNADDPNKEVQYKVMGSERALSLLYVISQFDAGIPPVGHELETQQLRDVVKKYGLMRDIAGVLAQVWRYSRFKNAGDMSQAYAGSMTPIQCKTHLRETLKYLETCVSVVQQLLLEAPIWSEEFGQPTIVERFGVVPDDNLRAVLMIGEQFEKRHGRGEWE